MYECWYGDEKIGYVDQHRKDCMQEAGTGHRFLEVRGFWQFVATEYVCE